LLLISKLEGSEDVLLPSLTSLRHEHTLEGRHTACDLITIRGHVNDTGTRCFAPVNKVREVTSHQTRYCAMLPR